MPRAGHHRRAGSRPSGAVVALSNTMRRMSKPAFELLTALGKTE